MIPLITRMRKRTTLGKYEVNKRAKPYESVAKKSKDTYFDLGDKGWKRAAGKIVLRCGKLIKNF